MAIADASRPARESRALVALGMPHMEGVEAATSAKSLQWSHYQLQACLAVLLEWA